MKSAGSQSNEKSATRKLCLLKDQSILLDTRIYAHQSRVELRDITNIEPSYNSIIANAIHDNRKIISSNLDSLNFKGNSSQDSNEGSISESSSSNSSENQSYHKFKLEKRNTPAHLCSSQHVSHKYLPAHFKNCSKYKRNLINFFRRNESIKNKTESCRQHILYKSSFKCKGNFAIFLERKKNKDSNAYLAKTQPVPGSSCRYGFNKDNQFKLIDPFTNKKKDFLIFEEELIGFTSQWQKQLKIKDTDDDIDTDEEQLEASVRRIKKDLKEATYILSEGINKIRNLGRFNLGDKGHCAKINFN